MKPNILLLLSALTLGAAVCLVSPSVQAQRAVKSPALDPVAKEALLLALAGPEGEYAAQAEYVAILQKFGAAVQPYANILAAEKQHIAALKLQCQKYGVTIPADPYLGNVIPPATLLEAAEAGVAAETLNVAMYDAPFGQSEELPEPGAGVHQPAGRLAGASPACFRSRPREWRLTSVSDSSRASGEPLQ